MRYLVIAIFIAVLSISATKTAKAQPLELGINASPTIYTDQAYEGFSADDLYSIRFAGDLRLEVANLGGFKIVPFLGYRFGSDTGSPYYILDTELTMHDFLGGFRVRKGLVKWMGVFLELSGGVLWVQMNASPYEGYDGSYGYEGSGVGERDEYKDNQITWSAGGLVGLEFYLPKAWMRSRGVKRFNFGGEIGAGYIRRGDMTFEPTLEAGTDNSIDSTTLAWGDLNLSGWVIQAGVSFKFF